MFEMIKYQNILLSMDSKLWNRSDVVSDYSAVLLSNLHFIIDRYACKAGSPWIDTKIDLATGKDFPNSDVLRGPRTVYTWIQGRALEALAGHALWLKKNNHREDSVIRQRPGYQE